MTINLRAAIDRMFADPDFARRVYEDPESTLVGECGLNDDDVRAVHAALAADVAEARDEVADVAAFDFGTPEPAGPVPIPYPNLSSLVSAAAARDVASGQASGRRQFGSIKIVKPTDASSP
jgi:hypothetical protein